MSTNKSKFSQGASTTENREDVGTNEQDTRLVPEPVLEGGNGINPGWSSIFRENDLC